MAASCGSFSRSMGSNRASALRSVANACTRLVDEFAVAVKRTRAGNGARSARYCAGALTRKTLNPSLIPSFFASGVSEYPAIASTSLVQAKLLHGRCAQVDQQAAAV
jgi:hypothetical protein